MVEDGAMTEYERATVISAGVDIAATSEEDLKLSINVLGRLARDFEAELGGREERERCDADGRHDAGQACGGGAVAQKRSGVA